MNKRDLDHIFSSPTAMSDTSPSAKHDRDAVADGDKSISKTLRLEDVEAMEVETSPTSAGGKREQEAAEGDEERDSKRAKLDTQSSPAVFSQAIDPSSVLPPSHKLLNLPPRDPKEITFLEGDVGISEYVGKGVSKIDGIIKQRCASRLMKQELNLTCPTQVH